MHSSRIDACCILPLPRFNDQRGSLTFIEAQHHVPFPIRRVFYIYDTPDGMVRGGHAHRSLEQVLICLAGAVEVEVDDGSSKKIIRLQRPDEGLYIPPMVWATERICAPQTVYLVLASEPYDESQYLRDYQTFLQSI